MANVVTTTSKQFTWNLKDVLKGLLVAVATPVFTIIMTSLKAGHLIFDWEAIGSVALLAAMGYMVKNFFTPGAIIVEAPEATVEAVKDGDATIRVTGQP